MCIRKFYSVEEYQRMRLCRKRIDTLIMASLSETVTPGEKKEIEEEISMEKDRLDSLVAGGAVKPAFKSYY